MEHSQAGPAASTASSQTTPAQRIMDRPLPPRPPPSRSGSSDHRRRHTMLEPNRYHLSGQTRYHTMHPPQSNDLAARVLPQFRAQHHHSPQMSDIVPHTPQWQPDEEVSKCPVCDQEFTLFFRKHHCRKCGKVVCGDCSRHRITVPARYIAQPPWAAEGAVQDAGVAVPVRVCNPCVPDPWTPGSNHAPPVPPPDSRPASNRYSLPPPPPFRHAAASAGHRHTSSTSNPPPYQAHAPPRLGAAVAYRRPLPQTPPHTAQAGSLDSRFVYAPAHPQALPVPPRREVNEEDECPVCGRELPPGDAIREEHITECVMTRFSGEASSASPITPAAAVLEGASSSPLSSARARSQSYRSRGLYQYTATEKDCIDGDGEEHECPICFEEFQPGDKLGRLECLCRFHHTCIREWWSRKGPGMCPVHASHE